MKTRDTYLPFGTPHFSEAEIEAVTRVLRSGWVGMGPETASFEKELADYLSAPHVVAVNSCTSALFLSLKALGVGPGDEVIVPSLTWCSTANAAMYLGATPVFCDVDLETMSASEASIKAALTAKTKAVVHVHYGGLAGDMKALRGALPPGVGIVEDAAHALGAKYSDGRPVGSSGNLTCFSFYANKNLSTGDGGAVATTDARLAEAVRLISQQGLGADAWKRFSNPTAMLTSEISELGYKMNFTDLQASIGRVQLKRQGVMQKHRVDLAACYLERLNSAGLGLRFQRGLGTSEHAHHLFVIRLPIGPRLSRNQVLLDLRARNIGASIHYAPLHTQPLYRAYARHPLPHTEELMHEILTLPIGPSVSQDDASAVAGDLLELIRRD
jgi:perosamine synthetase